MTIEKISSTNLNTLIKKTIQIPIEDNFICLRSLNPKRTRFEPPGITVAVAKDRAIESLLQVNDRFVLNILQENNYLHLFRHFLKRFPPGANRFEGVELMLSLIHISEPTRPY